MVTRRRAGFTLVETLIAMVLSTIVISLVSHAFLIQNQYYSTQTLRTGAQDNVRAATELIAREIRTAMDEGIIVAGPRTLTVRSPVTVTVVCSRVGFTQPRRVQLGWGEPARHGGDRGRRRA